MSELVKRLRIKADMISMCEPIAFGSDSELMREAADYIENHVIIPRKDLKGMKRNVRNCNNDGITKYHTGYDVGNNALIDKLLEEYRYGY